MDSILPYWDEDLDLSVPYWLPYGKDFSPVESNGLYSPLFGMLSALAIGLSSEFLYMHGMQCGNVGTMSRQNVIAPAGGSVVEFGFSAVFSWSSEMEMAVLPLLPQFAGLKAGLTMCSIWNGDVLLDEVKVILLVNENPFFDENMFAAAMVKRFGRALNAENTPYAFFAEKFGYRRCAIPYETDKTTQMDITQLLFDMEFDATREIMGPSPEVKLPEFMKKSDI